MSTKLCKFCANLVTNYAQHIHNKHGDVTPEDKAAALLMGRKRKTSCTLEEVRDRNI